VEWKLRSVNFRRVSDPRRVLRQGFRVTGISDDSYRSMMGVIVISLGARRSATFGAPGSVTEPTRDHKQTLRDVWVLIDIHLENCRRYLRFFGCT